MPLSEAIMPLASELRALETVPDSYIVVSPELVILTASNAYLADTLKQREDLVGRYLFDAFPDNPAAPEADAVRNWRASLELVLATGQPHQMALQHYDVLDPERPGHFVERHWLPRNTPVFDAQGQLSYIIHSSVNVTKEVQARRAMAQAQGREQEVRLEAERERQRLRQVFELTPAAICIQRGPTHCYEYANQAYLDFFPGRPIIGQSVAEALPETVESGVVALLDQVYQTGETYYGYELPLLIAQPDGSHRQMYFTFTYQALRENGEIVGISTFAYNVAEQVLARQQEEIARQRMERLFMEAPAAICILSGPDLVYELVNPGYQALFPGRELLGQPILMVLPEIANNAAYTTFRQVYETGHTHEELALLIPLARPTDGVLEERYFRYIQQPRYAVDGRIDGVLVFAFEVTEQVRIRQQVQSLNKELATANDELMQSNTQLMRTNADLDMFIYTASHDLRSPVANIEGLVTALRQELLGSETNMQAVDQILALMDNSLVRFQTTIGHLSNILRSEQTSKLASAEEVDLAGLINDICLDLATPITETQAQLQVDVTQCPSLHASPKDLRSIVANLLSNALKYRAPDRLPVVHVRASCHEQWAELHVQDNGLGLSDEQQQQLFQLFRRFHNHQEGSGVGLYAIRRLVEQAGGTISVASEVGVGSIFTVRLPLAAQSGERY